MRIIEHAFLKSIESNLCTKDGKIWYEFDRDELLTHFRAIESLANQEKDRRIADLEDRLEKAQAGKSLPKFKTLLSRPSDIYERIGEALQPSQSQVSAQPEVKQADDAKDAARYRWLRNIGSVQGALDWSALGANYQDLPQMDISIDAAIQAQGAKQT